MDRKSWLLLLLSGALLASYFHFSQKEAAAQAASKTPPSQVSSAAPTNPANTGLVVEEAPDANIEESLVTLTSRRSTDQSSPGVVEFTFTNLGGGLKYASMLEHLSVGHLSDESANDHKFVRINEHHRRSIGALMLDPNQDRFDTSLYRLTAQGADFVTYEGKLPNGLTVTKEFRLAPLEPTKKDSPNPYQLKLKVTLKNDSTTAISTENLGIYSGSVSPLHKGEIDSYGGFFTFSNNDFNREQSSYFKGGMFSSKKDRYFDKSLESVAYTGSMNQFFASILAPAQPGNYYVWAYGEEFRGIPDAKNQYTYGSALGLPKADLAPTQVQSFDYELYLGPKEYSVISRFGKHGDEVMDYGWFGFVSRPLNALLGWLHDLFGNWGWAVVGLTIIIRSLLWPVHNKSTRAMKRMQQLQPKMTEIREKYANDPQKMNVKMMELYRDYGINPLGGCLPMLVQIPIFFGFYKMLQYAVELRNQPWLGWVHDLSQPDTIWSTKLGFNLPILGNELPLNVLPILMAITMVIQMRLTPQPQDKVQATLMKLMPIFFFVFCYNFASALALYWTTQNLFTIAQTLINKRLPEPELKPRNSGNGPRKKSFVERMAEAQAAKMKEMEARNGGGMRSVGGNVKPSKKQK